jgi:hypothetical protein
MSRPNRNCGDATKPGSCDHVTSLDTASSRLPAEELAELRLKIGCWSGDRIECLYREPEPDPAER